VIDVVYLAGGKGVRAKLGYPKQFARLGGKPIMVHGLEILQRMSEIGRIILTYPKGEGPEETKAVIHPYIQRDDLLFVEGGSTRQKSVANALEWVETPEMLIMEAVRPFVTIDLIRRVIKEEGDVVTPWRTATSSVVTGNGIFLNRDNVGEVQMPQKFNTEKLRKAHLMAQAGAKLFSDDASLVWKMLSIPPRLVEGLEVNMKITTPLDLVIAEAIHNARYCDRE
jgi:2-C-methyl-D-erythritol 4-phosphate cytidylyltransferase